MSLTGLPSIPAYYGGTPRAVPRAETLASARRSRESRNYSAVHRPERQGIGISLPALALGERLRSPKPDDSQFAGVSG
jgi:hypothetical protein